MASDVSNEELEKIANVFDMLVDDSAVPRNVRTKMQAAKTRLLGAEEFPTRVSAAIYALDEVSNDINLPMHARTLIWNMLSELETLKNRS